MNLSWRPLSCGSPPARMGGVAFVTEFVEDWDNAVERQRRSCSTSTSVSASPYRSSTRGTWGDDLVVVHGGLGSHRYALDDTWVLTSSSAASSSAEGEGGGGGGWVLSPPPPSLRPPPRAFHCGAVLGSCLFVFGGHAVEGEKEGEGANNEQKNKKSRNALPRIRKRSDLWKLDLLRMQWEEVKQGGPSFSWPCARDFAAMCSLPPPRPPPRSPPKKSNDDDGGDKDEGTLLLHGGLDSDDRRLGDTWMFFVSSSKWTRVCRGGGGGSGGGGDGDKKNVSPSSLFLPRPLPRFGATLTRLRDKAFLFGGDTGGKAGGEGKAELWSFVSSAAASAGESDDGGDGDDSPPAWVLLDLPGAPEPRKGHTAAAIGDWLVVSGGRRVAGGEGGRNGNGSGGVRRNKGKRRQKEGSPGNALLEDVFVLDCGSGSGGGHFRWRRASGGLGFSAGGEEDDDDDPCSGSDGDESGTSSLRREYASLVSLPAVDRGSLLLLGGGDGSGALCSSSSSLIDCRARIATTCSAAFGPRSPPPPPPPPLLGPAAALSSLSGRSSVGRRRLDFGDDDGDGLLTPGSDVGGGEGEGPGTPVSFSNAPLSLLSPPPSSGVEERMRALRSRLGCCSSAAVVPSVLPAPASSSASGVAALCAKETEELTLGDLRILLSALEKERRQRQEEDDDDERIKNFELSCPVDSAEELKVGQAEALKAAAAALCL